MKIKYYIIALYALSCFAAEAPGEPTKKRLFPNYTFSGAKRLNGGQEASSSTPLEADTAVNLYTAPTTKVISDSTSYFQGFFCLVRCYQDPKNTKIKSKDVKAAAAECDFDAIYEINGRPGTIPGILVLDALSAENNLDLINEIMQPDVAQLSKKLFAFTDKKVKKAITIEDFLTRPHIDLNFDFYDHRGEWAIRNLKGADKHLSHTKRKALLAKLTTPAPASLPSTGSSSSAPLRM